MTPMDELAWARCPDCLGLLDAVATAEGAVQYCRLCGYTGEAVASPDPPRANEDGIVGMRGC